LDKKNNFQNTFENSFYETKEDQDTIYYMVEEDFPSFIYKTLPWIKNQKSKQDLRWLDEIMNTKNHPSLIYEDEGKSKNFKVRFCSFATL
jgi:hypothetical protein